MQPRGRASSSRELQRGAASPPRSPPLRPVAAACQVRAQRWPAPRVRLRRRPGRGARGWAAPPGLTPRLGLRALGAAGRLCRAVPLLRRRASPLPPAAAPGPGLGKIPPVPLPAVRAAAEAKPGRRAPWAERGFYRGFGGTAASVIGPAGTSRTELQS